eukprot:7388354-Prymnesium_polylepis.1
MANFLGQKDEHQVITAAIAPRIERFNPEGIKPLQGQEISEHAKFMEAWSKVNLAQVFGFPLWEKEVFLLLQRTFGDLHSIFIHYAKSGTAGSGSAQSSETLQQTELVNLSLDVGLATEAFPMARVQQVFERADQPVNRKDKNNALDVSEFLECVVMLSFHRTNPNFGEVGNERTAEYPLPNCLEQLLYKNLLKKAKKDVLAKVKRDLMKDSDVQSLLAQYKPKLRIHYEENAKNDSTLTGMKPLVTMNMFSQDLFDRKVIKDIKIRPTSAVQGELLPEIHSNLSWLDTKSAFVTAQKGEDTENERQTIDFSEFLIALGLCGHIKYEEAEEMSLAHKVAAIIANYLGQKDEQQVLTAAVAPKVDRFDARRVERLQSQSTSEHKKILETWGKMKLSHVHGFPLWEEGVFQLLQASYVELFSIFTQYAKSGS